MGLKCVEFSPENQWLLITLRGGNESVRACVRVCVCGAYLIERRIKVYRDHNKSDA